MSTAKTVTVRILDKDYQVNCQEEEIAALQKSANYLDQQMRDMKEKSNVIGLDRLAVMAALNLTNDLLSESEKANQLGSEQAEMAGTLESQQSEIANLNNKLDSALTRLRSKLS